MLAVGWAFARGPATKERLVVAAAAAIAAFMAFNKVFSPQFMIWLVPVVALVRGWWPRALLAASLVLTQLWFPRDYWHLSLEFRARESWLLLARDLLVVALFVVLARDLQHERLGEDRAFREPLEPVFGLKTAGEILEKQWLFDVYSGKGIPEGKHSLTIALQLRKFGENLTDEEANQVRDRAVRALEELGATQR